MTGAFRSLLAAAARGWMLLFFMLDVESGWPPVRRIPWGIPEGQIIPAGGSCIYRGGCRPGEECAIYILRNVLIY